jgi:hypothetical protein
MIFDKERRQMVVDWIETREEAEARLGELIEAEPEAEGVLIILGTLDEPE